MIVRLLVDCTGPNPDFQPPKDAAAARAYARRVPRDRTIPAGTEINHPDAWRLCVPEMDARDPRREVTRAEPVDDEARDAFDVWKHGYTKRKQEQEELDARIAAAEQEDEDDE